MATVTILRPPLLVPNWSDSGPLTPPIGPAYLAASLRQAGHMARIVDGLGENPFQVTRLFDDKVMAIGLRSEEIVERIEPDTDLIGVSCMFSQDWPEIRRLIQMVRRRFPSIPIVAGGEHITATAGFTLDSTPEVDVCVIGEGEETIVELAAAVRARHARSTRFPAWCCARTRRRGLGLAAPCTDSDDAIDRIAHAHPKSRRHSVAGLGSRAARPTTSTTASATASNRGRSMPMIATRGCPYQCTFCSNPEMWTTRWYARDPEQGARGDPDLPGALQRDELRLLRPDRDREAKLDHPVHAARILERKMEFTWQLPSGTRSEAIDDEVSRLLYESGCRNMSYAPESGSPEVLKRIKKVVKLDQAGSLGPRRRAQQAERQAEHHHGVPQRVAEGARPDGAASSPAWGSPACTT